MDEYQETAPASVPSAMSMASIEMCGRPSGAAAEVGHLPAPATGHQLGEGGLVAKAASAEVMAGNTTDGPEPYRRPGTSTDPHRHPAQPPEAKAGAPAPCGAGLLGYCYLFRIKAPGSETE